MRREKTKEVKMAELQDYSGEFRPDVTMHDFSKDRLVEAWRAASKLYEGINGLWYTLIRERFGAQMAAELHKEIWKRNSPLEVRWVRESMNIQGDDIAAFFKFIQTYPGLAGIQDVQCELKNKNHGIYTVNRCLALEYAERHGDTVLLKHGCEEIDMEAFERLPRLFNPKIKMTCLKLPPRKNKDEIACQWEFELEE